MLLGHNLHSSLGYVGAFGFEFGVCRRCVGTIRGIAGTGRAGTLHLWINIMLRSRWGHRGVCFCDVLLTIWYFRFYLLCGVSSRWPDRTKVRTMLGRFILVAV